jgi:stage V sporulation protein B
MLLPEISCAKARNNTLKIKETVKKSISYTLTLSIFTAFVFLNLGFELGEIVYNDSDVGFVLKVLAPIVPFMYLESIASGILKGLDRQVQMFIYNLADSGARLLAVFFLVPVFGIKAYLGIMICSNSFTSLLCYKNLKNATKIDTDYLNWIIKPSILGVLGIIASANFKKQINSLILKTVACILVQSVVFFLPIFICWIFKNKEKSKIKPADF